jgi:hypothetical protein
MNEHTYTLINVVWGDAKENYSKRSEVLLTTLS